MSEKSESSLFDFRNFGSNTIRDIVIGLIIAGICYISNTIINLSKESYELRGRVTDIETKFQGDINKINGEREILQSESVRRLNEFDKKFEQLNFDINKKLDKINDKIDGLTRDLSLKHTGI